MTVLLIEDDEVKRGRLSDFIRAELPDVDLFDAKSVQSGLKRILQHPPRLVILDMNLPSFDITPTEAGGRLQQFGGRELLRQMQRRKLKIPVIVVTQFDYFGEGKDKITLSELDMELRNRFTDNYVGKVYYHATHDDWKRELAELLARANSREA